MGTRLLLSKRIGSLITLLLLWVGTSIAQQNQQSIHSYWETDTSQHTVPLSEFQVLLKRDAIPPVDSPHYWKRSKAQQVYYDHEPVIALSVKGDARAYPLSILMFHEIVNDRINGRPLTITYCPLCNAALVFDRQLHHKEETYLLDFGTTGMLRHSDLVMWDRQTESWWQQMTGEALVGQLTGAKLDLYPSQLITLGTFLEDYPQGKVLTQPSADTKPYGKNPYTQYDKKESRPKYSSQYNGDRLPPKARIVNIRGIDKIYPYNVLKRKSVINDDPRGQPVVLFYAPGKISVLDKKNIKESKSIGTVTVFSRVVDGDTLHFQPIDNQQKYRDKSTGSVWTITGKCKEGPYAGKELTPKVHGHHFAFAWLSFHPEVSIYGLSEE